MSDDVDREARRLERVSAALQTLRERNPDIFQQSLDEMKGETEHRRALERDDSTRRRSRSRRREPPCDDDEGDR